ncbi:MAG TPA: hypothetical protein VFX61_12425 [Micromonosporaceae bacterium]|nr:hypothetical protein [Micromonosporaceae bacterium]
MLEAGGGRSGRRWLVWVSVGLVLGLLICSGNVLLLVTVVDRLPGLIATTPAATGPASTPTGPSADPVQAAFAQRVVDLLDEQAAALLRGDERGFLAVADPATPVTAELKRQFQALRALQVAVWRPEARTSPVRSGDEWRMRVSFEHCFVTPACRPGPATFDTRWVETESRPRLVALKQVPLADPGPRPWQVSRLVVAVGERTLVATTEAFRSRLPQLLAEAEEAATVADRYALSGKPPDRYRVFYGGKTEWKTWYGGGQAEWSAGYATAVGGGHYEVVLNSDGLHSSVLDDLLRHELTHAASLPEGGYASGRNWWLVEGLAEFAAAGARPLNRYENLPDVRRLIGDGRWNGRLDAVRPTRATAEWEVGGRYGIGYLAVRHLVDRFGEPALLEFFKAVVHDRRSASQAAKQVFGEEWSELHDECVAYARGAAA